MGVRNTVVYPDQNVLAGYITVEPLVNGLEV